MIFYPTLVPAYGSNKTHYWVISMELKEIVRLTEKTESIFDYIKENPYNKRAGRGGSGNEQSRTI